MAEQAKHTPLMDALMRAYDSGFHEAMTHQGSDRVGVALLLQIDIPQYVAAPELLEELKAIRATLTTLGPKSVDLESLDAALAKVEGAGD